MFLRFQTITRVTQLAPAFVVAGMQAGRCVDAIHTYWMGA